MQRPGEDVVQELRAKYGPMIEFELPDFDFTALLLPFTPTTCQRYVDEGVVSVEDASDRLLVRHVLWPPPKDVQNGKRRCAKLGTRVADVLCEDAGLPLTAPAMTSSDRLTSATAPGVLAHAGLEDSKAAELLAAHPDVRLQIVVITDATGDAIFSCVLASPSEIELGLLRDARDKKRGYAAACLSASRACVVWCPGDIDQIFDRYPAIPTLVLPAEINELGGSDAVKRFRRR